MFGWSRAQVSIAYSVAQFVSGFSSPLVGWLVDRLGPRRLILIGGVTLAIGLMASSRATQLWHMVVLYGIVMTLGANCLGLVVFVPLLSRYFVRNRGMAVSVVQSANGFARAFSAPVTTMMIDGLGWRGAYLWQGAFMAVVLLPLASLFRGLGETTHASRRIASTDGWTLREAMRTPHFWLLGAVYMFTGLGSFLVALHQLAFAVDIGFDKLYAAWVLGMGAFLVAAGRDRDRHHLRLHRARIIRGRDLRHLDPGRRVRDADHLAGPARAAVGACVPVRIDLGRARPGDHREDRGFVPWPEPWYDPGRDHHRHWHGLGERVVARGLRVRCHGVVQGGVRAVDFLLFVRKCRVLGVAAAAGAARDRPLDSVWGKYPLRD